MIVLVSGRKNEGYTRSLVHAFFSSHVKAPVKSSFCKFRKKISFTFFRYYFYKLVGDFMPYRDTFKGRRIYAIDGKWLYIPRTKELEKQGFTGRKTSQWRETLKLRMHLTHAYDVLSGVSKGLRISRHQDEIAQATSMVESFESGCIALYDRFYLCHELIRTHLRRRNFFIMRAKSRATLKQIVQFAEGRKSKTSFKYQGVELTIVKVKFGKKTNYFLTNLFPSELTPKRIAHLYRQRWDVESSFKELVESISLEQWHTTSYNGILQELYARFWIYNFTKIQIYLRQKKRKRTIGKSYYRASLKCCHEWIVRNINDVFKRSRRVFRALEELIKHTTQKRERYKYSYPREIKRPASPYKYANTKWSF